MIIFFPLYNLKSPRPNDLPTRFAVMKIHFAADAFGSFFVSALQRRAGEKSPDVTTVVIHTCCATLAERSVWGKRRRRHGPLHPAVKTAACVTAFELRCVFCASASKRGSAAAPAPISKKYTVHVSWFASSHSSAVEQGFCFGSSGMCLHCQLLAWHGHCRALWTQQ